MIRLPHQDLVRSQKSDSSGFIGRC